jgi:hypothetical protein
MPDGTVTSTWYKPTAPGAKPLNCGVPADWPPMVMVGMVVVFDNGLVGAPTPSAG